MTSTTSRLATLVVASVGLALSALGVFVAGCLPALPGPGDGPSPAFANVDNTPFATRTLGPSGAVLYDPDTTSAEQALGAAAVRSEGDAADAFVRMLREHGLKNPDAVFRPNRRAVPVRDGKVVLTSLSEASARQGEGEDLTFRFAGWSDAEAAMLREIEEQVYPLCVTYYGHPAFPHQVTVKPSPVVSNFAEGLYDAASDSILLAPLSDNRRNTEFALTRHILHAMRDEAMLFYDAWEEGQVLAVANEVMADLHADWDPTLERSEYSLNMYELLNEPELGSPSIWNTGFQGLVVPRLALSSGAWMKVLVEDRIAVAKFNEQYYPLFRDDPTVAGDVPRLNAVMSGIVSQVEGLGYYDWFRRQYALDTSAPQGERLYCGMLPTFDAVALFVTHTVMGTDGAERGAGGLVALDFWDYTHQYSLFVQEGYEIPIPATGGSAGIGEHSASLYNIGGAQRINIDLVLQPIVKHLVFPYNSRREDIDYSADPEGINIYGAVTGRNEGTVSIALGDGEPTELDLGQGSFRGHFGEGFLSPGKVTFLYRDAAGEEISRQINVGYFDYAIVDTMGRRAQFNHVIGSTSTGLRLISFPGLPLRTDESTVLGLPPEQVLLASWQADAAGDDKYRIYPDMPPIIPGRGYWLKSDDPVQVTVDADVPDTLGVYRVPLSPGWNLVGVPVEFTFPPDNLRFDQGGETVSLPEAAQNGWVRSVMFEYDGNQGVYRQASQFRPWEAYWIRCITAGGCNLVFFESSASSARAASAPVTAADRLRAAGASVAELLVGDGTGAVPLVLAKLASAGPSIDNEWDVEAPPPAPGSVLVVGVVRAEGLLAVDADPSDWRDLLIRTSTGSATIEVVSGSVECDGLGTLSAGDRTTVPVASPYRTLRVAVR